MKKNSAKSVKPSKSTKTANPETAIQPSKWGLLLRRWREGKGMSQAQAAEALGVPPTSIAQWEQGRRNLVLSDDAIHAVLRVLGDSGLVAQDAPLPEGQTLSELETRVIHAIRAEFKSAKKESK